MAGHPNDPIDLVNAFERFATGRPAKGNPTGPMRRTGNSLWHVGWLLLPEPGEEQRGWGYVLWLLVLGGFFTILGVAGLFRTPHELHHTLRQWSLALLLLVQALLCSPSLYGRSRVMLGVWAAAHSPYVRIVAMRRS
jgi:hypothetical protein